MELALSEARAVAGDTVLSAGIRKRYRDSAKGAFQLDAEFQAPAGITILFGASGARFLASLDSRVGFASNLHQDVG